MRRTFQVSLSGFPVGHLSEGDDGRISFRFLDEYRHMPQRPVLSQSFEDDLFRPYRGKRNELPAFFANLVPEGPLRELIEASLRISHGDEIALLAAVGRDLPGAVEIQIESGKIEDLADGDTDEPAVPDPESEEGVLRFSLAGVQLKFSMLREGAKLTIPAHGRLGEWIVKLDSSRFSHVVENEFASLEWARAAGFDVPECHLQPCGALPPSLRGFANPDSQVLVIRRYDRDGPRRIHQEDFAQVVGLPPRLKYDLITYEQCAVLVRQIAGEDAYLEFIRRLAFVIGCGNEDAHLKNWSFVYPDGVNAKLSPLYDQVCTIAWPELGGKLALKLAGLKPLLAVDEAVFVRLAKKARVDVDSTISVLRDTLIRMAAAWHVSKGRNAMPQDHLETLRSYWMKAPLLKPYAAMLVLE